MKTSISNSGVALVNTLQVNALGDTIDSAVQNAALVCAFSQYSFNNGTKVAVIVINHAAYFKAGRWRTLQTVNKADLGLKRLALPDLVLW